MKLKNPSTHVPFPAHGFLVQSSPSNTEMVRTVPVSVMGNSTISEKEYNKKIATFPKLFLKPFPKLIIKPLPKPFLEPLQWKCKNLFGGKQPKFTEMSTPLSYS